MLDSYSLKKYAGDLNLYQTEKDYLQHIVLWRIYQSISTELCFKGGTALQKVYNLGRFSEDLDFTADSASQKDPAELDQKITAIIERINDFYRTAYSKTTNQSSLSYKLKIEGPLYSKPQSIQTIPIEISFREALSLNPEAVPVSPIYRDISNYVVNIMNMEEILAEKVMAIMTREKARDLYDIYFLLSKRTKFNPKLADKKLAYYNLKYDKNAFLKRSASLEIIWEKELQPLMKNVPPFKPILELVKANV